MSVTFPKAKAGDRIRLTGSSWDKDGHGVAAGDIVTVTSIYPLGSREGAPMINGTTYSGMWIVFKDDEYDYGGELVTGDADPVDPEHYKFGDGVEVIQITRHMDFLTGNAVKYLTRAGRKGDRLTDLRKALRYIEWAIEDAEGR